MTSSTSFNNPITSGICNFVQSAYQHAPSGSQIAATTKKITKFIVIGGLLLMSAVGAVQIDAPRAPHTGSMGICHSQPMYPLMPAYDMCMPDGTRTMNPMDSVGYRFKEKNIHGLKLPVFFVNKNAAPVKFAMIERSLVYMKHHIRQDLTARLGKVSKQTEYTINFDSLIEKNKQFLLDGIKGKQDPVLKETLQSNPLNPQEIKECLEKISKILKNLYRTVNGQVTINKGTNIKNTIDSVVERAFNEADSQVDTIVYRSLNIQITHQGKSLKDLFSNRDYRYLQNTFSPQELRFLKENLDCVLYSYVRIHDTKSLKHVINTRSAVPFEQFYGKMQAVTDPQPGDLVAYLNLEKGVFEHHGIYAGDGLVDSKWCKIDSVYRHPLFDITYQYPSKVVFFRRPNKI